MSHIPQYTIYLIGTDKEDAYNNCTLPWDDEKGARHYALDNGDDLKVFAMTVFGPQDYNELEEV